MSYGTLEQLYLLMRACVAQLFSTNGEKILLFLDDPLTHADEKRLSAVLQTIAELSKNQQIFYFTKYQKVIDCLKLNGIDFHLITLQRTDEMQMQTRQASGAAFRTRVAGR